eukprot:Awhi_evm1s1496
MSQKPKLRSLTQIKTEVVDMYDESLNSEFSLEEVNYAIKSLKHHKAPGYDGIVNKLLKLINEPNGLDDVHFSDEPVLETDGYT